MSCVFHSYLKFKPVDLIDFGIKWWLSEAMENRGERKMEKGQSITIFIKKLLLLSMKGTTDNEKISHAK
jgi:hypothetical protein